MKRLPKLPLPLNINSSQFFSFISFFPILCPTSLFTLSIIFFKTCCCQSYFFLFSFIFFILIPFMLWLPNFYFFLGQSILPFIRSYRSISPSLIFGYNYKKIWKVLKPNSCRDEHDAVYDEHVRFFPAIPQPLPKPNFRTMAGVLNGE